MEYLKESGFAKNVIYDIADYIANEMELEVGASMFDVVKKLKGNIQYQGYDDWLKSEDGSIIVRGKEDFDIYVSSFTGPLKDRFTIAHEIGHYFIHSQMGKIPGRAKRFSGKIGTRVEWEANWFAAGFLMPTSEIKKCASLGITELAGKFNVSTQVASIRKKLFLSEDY